MASYDQRALACVGIRAENQRDQYPNTTGHPTPTGAHFCLRPPLAAIKGCSQGEILCAPWFLAGTPHGLGQPVSSTVLARVGVLRPFEPIDVVRCALRHGA